MNQVPGNFDVFLAYVTHLRSEHERLRECLDRVEQQWLVAQQLPPGTDDWQKVIDSLQSLRGELARHFVEEESGGCLEEAVSRQPALSGEATRLENEHPELLDALDQLVAALRAISPPAARIGQIEQEFRAFAEKLLAHEAAENRILEESFGIEVQ